MCICLGLSQGLVSGWIPHVLGLGLDPGSYQNLKIPLIITVVKQKSQCQGEKKSQLPGTPRSEFVLSSEHRLDHRQTDISQQGVLSEHLGECRDGAHIYSQNQHVPISTLAFAHHTNSRV